MEDKIKEAKALAKKELKEGIDPSFSMLSDIFDEFSDIDFESLKLFGKVINLTQNSDDDIDIYYFKDFDKYVALKFNDDHKLEKYDRVFPVLSNRIFDFYAEKRQTKNELILELEKQFRKFVPQYLKTHN